MDSLELKAYAKINLGLDVVGKMDNGYHEVRMIMQSVNLHDRLKLTVTEAPEIRLTSNRRFLPVNENNLVWKAVDLVRREYGISSGIRAELTKRIPVAAGMAGGSTDAAAAIKGMDRLFGLKMSRERMAELGVRLGADVPYCLMGGTALAEGIGEKLTRIGRLPHCNILIVKPQVSISTPAVYKALDELTEYTHPDIDALKAAIERRDLKGMCALMGNVLERVTCAGHPEIVTIAEKMKQGGAINAMMSGSGPTVFGIFEDRKAAEQAFRAFKRGPYATATFLTTPIESV